MNARPQSVAGETAVEPGPEDAVRYAGLATRVISFVLDAALIGVAAIVIGVGAALIQGVLHLPSNVQTILKAIGAGAYVLGTVAYFAGFWSATGQTPGARVMRIRVLASSGGAVTWRRALVRCAGVVLAALPLFAGFIRILFDTRRRGLQDRVAGTVVVEAPELSLAQSLRLSKRTAHEAMRRASALSPVSRNSNGGDGAAQKPRAGSTSSDR